MILNNAGLRVLTGCIKLSNIRGEQHIPVNVVMHFPGAQNVLLNYLVIESSRLQQLASLARFSLQPADLTVV